VSGAQVLFAWMSQDWSIDGDSRREVRIDSYSVHWSVARRKGIDLHMIGTNQESQVLILSTESALAAFVETIFNEEAQKSELAWTAKSAELASAGSELLPASKTDLVIVLASMNRRRAIEQQLSSWKLPVEFWDAEGADAPERELRSHVNGLIIRLVLKGGRRPASTGASAQANITTKAIPQPADSIKKNATVRVSRERGGRRGKTVTIVTGLPLLPSNMTQLCTELKQLCGSGGTAKDGILEIQGDHVEKIMTALLERGYKPKRKGG